jgi:general secretion pathway protein M
VTPELSPPTRRVLAIGILILVIALPYWLMVRPILDEFARIDSEIAEQQERLGRLTSIAERLATLESQRDALARGGNRAEGYLTGGSEAIVAADLQNRLKTLIANAGGKLASTQVLPATEEAGFRQVSVRVRLNTSINGLSTLLYELETGEPLLFIDNLDVSTRQDRPRAGETEGEADLSITFDVYGFLRPER